MIVCFWAGICLYGQVNSNGFVFRFDGNYNETTTSNALQSVIGYNAKTKNGSASLSAGYLYNRWLISLGFDYNHNKTDALGQFASLTSSATSVFAEQSAVSLNSYGGVLSANYFLPVWRNLYFTPGFYLGYGTIGGSNSGLLASATYSTGDFVSGSSSYAQEYDNIISSHYFYMQLSPELTWFFTNHFGLNIQMGGLGINVIDSDWRNSNKQINFNPSLWKFGIIFKI